MEIDKLSLSIEILKILLKENRFVSSTFIHRQLVREGIFHSECDRVERRRILRVLHSLETSGYVVSKIDSPKGKVPQEWKINLKAFPYLISLSEKEVLSLLLAITFVPERYKKLSVFKHGLRAIDRLSLFLQEEEKELIKESFEHLSHFSERFVEVDDKTLSLIFQAIREKRGILVRYRNSNLREIFPLKVFVYNGVMYVSALRDKGYRTYLVNRMKVIELTEKKIPDYLRKRYVGKAFSFSFESPFLMGIKLSSDYVKEEDIEKGVLLYPTQFFIEKRGDFVVVYLVGFLNKMFVSWLMIDDVVGFISPSEEMIKIAKERKLNRQYEELSLKMHVNKRRFNSFRNLFRSFLIEKEKIFKTKNVL